jgi:hypothetical protein
LYIVLIRQGHCHLFVFDSFVTHNQHKQYGGGRQRETMIVSNWKQARNQFNNQNKEKIQIEEL